MSEWEDVSEYVWARQAAGEYPRIPERPLVTDCRSYGEYVYPPKTSKDMLTTNESLFFIDQHIILRRIFAR